jgi:hypothetical protein
VVVPAAIAPEINDNTDIGEARQGVDLVDHHLVVGGEEDVDAGHAAAAQVQAYQTLGCSGMARVDVFLTADNEVVINEINTLPISGAIAAGTTTFAPWSSIYLVS